MGEKAYKAVLFDMDGVVIDTNQAVTQFWSKLADQYGIQIRQKDFAEYVYGCQTKHTLNALFPFFDEEMRENVFKELEWYEVNAIYKEMKGCRQFISRLRKRNIATALVTSALPNKTEVVLRQLQLENTFDKVTTAGEISESKPNPQCYLTTMDSLGIQPKDCIVFEDAISGVKAAVGAGAYCVGISRDKVMLKRAGAKVVFEDFTDIKLRKLLGL